MAWKGWEGKFLRHLTGGLLEPRAEGRVEAKARETAAEFSGVSVFLGSPRLFFPFALLHLISRMLQAAAITLPFLIS